MRIYRAVWQFFCCVLGIFGALIAFAGSLTKTLALLVCVGSIGGVVAWIALDPEASTRSPAEERRIIATSTFLSATVTVELIGLGILLGAPTAILLVATMAGASPYAIRRCLRRNGHLPEPPPQRHEADPPEPRVAPDALSDDALCRAWRASFSALQRAESAGQRLRIVEERRAYLDEIERRSADGLAAWLASGPRAAGDPSKFVFGDGAAGRPRIDWDELHGTDQ